jgi:hypothetical protein
MGAVITGKKRLWVDDGSDRWVPFVSEKKKQREKEGRGFWGAAGLTALGPRARPRWLLMPLLLFFFVLLSFLFIFVFCFGI